MSPQRIQNKLKDDLETILIKTQRKYTFNRDRVVQCEIDSDINHFKYNPAMNAETEPDEQKGFINLANYHEKYIKTAKVRVVESEISAYLPLQVLLFYHWYYTFLMFFLLAALYGYKALYFKKKTFYDIIVIAIWFVAELVRQYFGFLGNTNENFSELIAFIIVSFFFAAPLLGYQFILFEVTFPLDRALDIVQALFLVFEIIFSIVAIRKLVRNQTAIFFLRNSKPEMYNRVCSI